VNTEKITIKAPSVEIHSNHRGHYGYLEFDAFDGIFSWDSVSANSKGYPNFVLTNLTGRCSAGPAKDYIEEISIEK